PARIHLHAPDIALRIDGRSIRIAAQALECREDAPGPDRSGGGIVGIGVDGFLETVGEIERFTVRAEAGAVGTDDAAVQHMQRQIGIEPEQLADGRAFLEIHGAGNEAPLPVDLAVVEAGPQFAGLGLDDPLSGPRLEIESVEPVAQRQDRTAALAQRHRADRFRQLPAPGVAPGGITGMDRWAIGIDPVEPLFLNVPQRAFAELIGPVAQHLDAQHVYPPVGCQKPTLSPPFSSRMARASSGVATSRPSPSMIFRASVTCSAFDFASFPLPAQRLSSSPTRILPPSAADCAAMRNWLAPAPRTDQRKLSPNSRSAVRFMCATSSGCVPMPPSRPNTDCTKKGGFTSPRSAKCARL